MWTFYCYESGPSGRLWEDGELEGCDKSAWQCWYEDQSRTYSQFQDAHDAVLDFIQTQKQWREPAVKKIDGTKQSLFEIRFKANNVQWRIGGTYGPGQMAFTVLLFFSHKGSVYTPKNWLKLLEKRCKDVAMDPVMGVRCEVPEEI